MKPADHVGPPCSCPLCVQAGVTQLEARRDPRSGVWLHGYDLKRWYEARDQFRRAARSAVGEPGRHAKGFERLATREPGSDD